MTNLSQSNIRLDVSFAEQDYVQSLLGYPEIDPDSPAAAPEILHKFINVVHNWLQEALGSAEHISGIKIGFERKVLTNQETKQYRVDSQFVSDQNWRSQYDLQILNTQTVVFLVDPPESESDEEKTEDSELNENPRSYSIADRYIEELKRLYPKLGNHKNTHIEELHAYVFWRDISAPILLTTESLIPIEASSSCDCYENSVSVPNRKKNRFRKCAVNCP